MRRPGPLAILLAAAVPLLLYATASVLLDMAVRREVGSRLAEVDPSASFGRVSAAPGVIVIEDVTLPSRGVGLDRLTCFLSGGPLGPRPSGLLCEGGTLGSGGPSGGGTPPERGGWSGSVPPLTVVDMLATLPGAGGCTLSLTVSGWSVGDSAAVLLRAPGGMAACVLSRREGYDSLLVPLLALESLPAAELGIPEDLAGCGLAATLGGRLYGDTLELAGTLTELDGRPCSVGVDLRTVPGGGGAELVLELPLEQVGGTVVATAGSLLAPASVDFVPGGSATVRFLEDGGLLEVDLDARLDSLRVYSAALAPETVVTGLGIDAVCLLDRRAGTVSVDSGTVTAGDAAVLFDLALETGADPRLELRAWSTGLSGAHILSAVPDALMGPLSGLELGGEASFDVRVVLDRGEPDSCDFEAEVDVSGLTVPYSPVSVGHLAHGGSCAMRDSWGGRRTVDLDPLSSGSFVPLDSLGPYLEPLLWCAEDATFRSHSGFCGYHVRNSLRANVRQGRFVRGGSTISMQLARNLFLGREKTLARKLQEVFLTWRLETYLSKDRIIEIYANIVELGPGVFGFPEASRYYFGAELAELGPREVAFLVSILPGPRLYHRFFVARSVPEYWEAYLDRLLSIAGGRSWMDPALAEAATGIPTVFRAAPEETP